MPTDPSHDRPDYGGIKGPAQYDIQYFEDTDEAQANATRPTADIESNELHAGSGKVCEHCHQPIEPGADVRKMLNGGYVHELCPAH